MNKPDRLALIWTDDIGYGGVAQYVYSLCSSLRSNGFEPVIACPPEYISQHLTQTYPDISWFPIRLAHETHFSTGLVNHEDARSILLTCNPNIILFANCCPFSNLAAREEAHKLGIPCVLVEGFAEPYLAASLQHLLDRNSQSYMHTKQVIAVSNHTLGILRSHYRLPEHLGAVVHYGRPERFFSKGNSDTRDEFLESIGAPTDKCIVTIIARLTYVKGHDVLLSALDYLSVNAQAGQLHVIIAGTGELESALQERVNRSGYSSSVTFLSHFENTALLLAASDIFVLPSRAEGMPLAVMEAMAASLPVCASAVSGIPEQIGNEGILLPDPNTDAQATILGLANALLQLASQPDLRRKIGTNLHQRAISMFSESRMISSTIQLIERALLPPGDYVSPTLDVIRLDHAFPNMIVGNTDAQPWPYLRRHATHNWYVDARAPMVGFLSRDEASILHAIAKSNAGSDGLEIGCWLGWSACHLASGGINLDVIDPLLANDDIRKSVEGSLVAAACLSKVRLHAGRSPDVVHQLAAEGKRWRVIFVDGDHEGQAPLADAIVAAEYAQQDAIIVFHDVIAPPVAQALKHLRECGWNTQVYNTMQIMAVAWRGNIKPPEHRADPLIGVTLPEALQIYAYSTFSDVPAEQDSHGVEHQTLRARLEAAKILVTADLKARYPDCPDYAGALFQQPATPTYMHSLYDSPRDISAACRASCAAQFHGDLHSTLIADYLASSAFLQYADMPTQHEFNEFHAKVRNHTFLSRERLWALYCATRQICENDIAGDIVECGTWRGGSAALIALTVQKYTKRSRMVSVFDSFEGMPVASSVDVHRGIHANHTEWGEGSLAAPPDTYIIPLIMSLGVSEYISIHQGYFDTSLPNYAANCDTIAILHADADWYSSTNAILDNLLTKLSPHAYIQIDDYGFWDGCRQAIDERAQGDNRLQTLTWIDDTGVWCRIPGLHNTLLTDQLHRNMPFYSLLKANVLIDSMTVLRILRPQLVVRSKGPEGRWLQSGTVAPHLTLSTSNESEVRAYLDHLIHLYLSSFENQTPDLYSRLIDSHLLIGQLQDAFKYSCSALLRYPTVDFIRTRFATVLLSGNLVQLAMNTLTETLSDPLFMPESRVLLARIYRALNDRQMCSRILTPLVTEPGAPVLGADVYKLYTECLTADDEA